MTYEMLGGEYPFERGYTCAGIIGGEERSIQLECSSCWKVYNFPEGRTLWHNSHLSA